MKSRMATYAGFISPDIFPLAHLYRTRPERDDCSVGEPLDQRFEFLYSERHLQCIWYDARLRPAKFISTGGETVEIDYQGKWNRGEGPDFKQAVLRIGHDRIREGDVEVHIHPSDWVRHGHSDNPAYNRVCAHFTFYRGQLPEHVLPPGTIEISLQDQANIALDHLFDSIDIAAYPYVARTENTPCFQIIKKLSPEQKGIILEAAGHERMRRKTLRLAADSVGCGTEQTLYSAFMRALGYAQNTEAFQALSEAVPVHRLRDQAEGDSMKAYALLLGVGGLLPDRTAAGKQKEGRAFIRHIWDVWWKMEAAWSDRIQPSENWRLGCIRPANHPVRRLMAAAELFSSAKPPAQLWDQCVKTHRAKAPRQFIKELSLTSGGFWDHRLSWHSPPSKKKFAVLGKQRATAIMLNVMIPYWASCHPEPSLFEKVLRTLPPEADNARIKETARDLLGPDYPGTFIKNSLARQGLIQIFQDYCIADRSRCRSCPFPALIRHHFH